MSNIIIKNDNNNLSTVRRKKKTQENKKTFFELYKSQKTLKDYMFYLKDFLKFVYEGEDDFAADEIINLMANIDKTDVEQYIASLFEDRKMKKTSVNKVISALKSLYKELEQYNIENPFRHVQLFKVSRNIDNILKVSSTDIQNIIDNFVVKNEKNYRNLIILYTLYYTGMRSDEIINIEFRNILYRENNYFLKLEKTKSGKEQYKPIHDNLVEKLEEFKINMQNLYQLTDEEILNHYIFCSDFEKNKALSYRALYNLIKSLGLVINKDISPHNIRHAIATELSLNGADLIEIRDFLGHSDTKVTEVYINAKTLLDKKVVSKIPEVAISKNNKKDS